MNAARDGTPSLVPSETYHLIGIAGTGMSALAQALLDRGAGVSGSDRFLDEGRKLPVLAVLEAAGARLFPQDGSGVRASRPAAAIASGAVEEGNADLDAARACGVPVWHRSRALAALMAGRRPFAVAGTSGKTTVTGMLGWILERAGLDPVVVNGGAVVNWRGTSRLGSVRYGHGAWFVFEADESDRSLLAYEPAAAVLTNISGDHFSFEESVGLFRQFLERVRGPVVVGPGVGQALGGGPELIEPRPWPPPSAARGGVVFGLNGTRFEVPLPGEHNGWNAVLAASAAAVAGVDGQTAAAALRDFRGIERRLERVGECNGAVVLDDYAHNPAKISAAWRAAGRMGAPVVGIWRPHGFGPLRKMMDDLVVELGRVMGPGDALVLLPVFYAGGTPSGAATSEELAERLEAAGWRAETVADAPAAAARARELARPGGVVLVMGARDPDLPRLARWIAAPSRFDSGATGR